MARHIANLLTGCRILGSILLLFFPAFSSAFYITYLLCGFSDMIDGTMARKTKSVSDFGSKLDTAADLVFITVSLIKILPTIPIPWWLWIWGGIIAIVKTGNFIAGYVSQKQFLHLHTIMNKATGFLLFLVPLTVSFIEFQYSSIAVCFLATLAAVQESVYIARDCQSQ